jgi:hypothetical protein
MLIFIDDSGDPGFKFDKGSTRYFVVLLLIFDDELETEKVVTAIKALRSSLGLKEDVEFKFHKSSQRMRRKFLEAINPYKFRLEVLVVDKTMIHVPLATSGEHSFYDYAIRVALEKAQPSIREAKIWIDGNRHKAFGRNYIAHLRQALNTRQRKTIKQARIVDSRGNVLIQMADMLAGAIRRSCETSKSDHMIYRSIIENHIENEHHFE